MNFPVVAGGSVTQKQRNSSQHTGLDGRKMDEGDTNEN